MKSSFKIDAINPHSAKIFAIHQAKAIPTLLSSSFHITQGGVEIKQFKFDPQANSLHISLEKQGENKGNLYIYLPDYSKKSKLNLRKIHKNSLKRIIFSLSISIQK